jgi:phosphate:Na+ symporter
VRVTYKIVPKQAHESAFRLEYIDKSMVGSPAVMAVQVGKEVDRVAGLVKSNFEAACEGILQKKVSDAHEIRDNEEVIDFLTGEIVSYITSANSLELPESVSNYLSGTFTVMNELEQIGDHAVKVLEQNEKMVDSKQSFSPAALEEIRLIYEEDSYLIERIKECYIEGKERVLTLDQLRETERAIAKMGNEAQANHMVRLEKGECSFDQGLAFVEILNSMSRIANHMTNVAEAAEAA